MEPNFGSVHVRIGVVYQQKGMYKEAVEEFFKEPGNPEEDTVLREAYNAGGFRTYMEKYIEFLLAREKTKQNYISPYIVAINYADLGRREEAFEWLEKSYEDGSIGMRWIKFEPRFDSIRSDPRFSDLLRRIGL
jgi:tetratricopeptide (TPR) repeat protein